MAGMGPVPKPDGQRARRNATVGMTQLPWAGRAGRTPPWPLIDDIEISARRDMKRDEADELDAKLAEDDEFEELAKRERSSMERRLRKLREEIFVLEERLKAQRKMERQLWRNIWQMPQAVQWEKLSWTRDIAQYVRHKVLAELGSMDDAKEARQMADRLGLTPLSLLRLRWEIQTKPDESATSRRSSGAAGSARARRGPLTAVPDLPAETPAPSE
jgi:hypothetical protein